MKHTDMTVLFGIACPVVAMLTAFTAEAAVPERADLVAKVAAGELKEAHAAWWGWNGEDDTAALQAAINSGVPKLVVDKMTGPWIVRPLFGRGNQTILFAPGVEVLAKKGEFRGGNDALFCYQSATNVTLSGYGAALRMRRMDYHNPPYTHAEWRHCLSLLSCDNVRVEGLVIAESGGDGIYVSTSGKRGHSGPPCRDIVIRDCICDKNYRQGISVISVDGLLVENTVMKDTWGTPPAAGIDFEPNEPTEELRRCVMRNCVCANNQGMGYEFYVGQLDATSRPMDVVFENCRSVGNGTDGFGYASTPWRMENYPTGLIRVKNCSFEREGKSGISIGQNPAGTVCFDFIDCSIADCCQKAPDCGDVRFWNPRNAACDNVLFRNLKVKQSAARPWVKGLALNWWSKPATDIRGNAEVTDATGATRAIALDGAWLKATQGQDKRPAGIDLRHVPFSPENLTVVDPAPGEMRDFAPALARDAATYLLYAEKARKVRLNVRLKKYGWKKFLTTAQVKDMAGKTVAEVKLPAESQWGDIAFDVPAAGFYRLVFDLQGTHACEIRRADAVLALEGGLDGQSFIGNTTPVYFCQEAGKSLALQASGSDGAELVRLTLSDPSGTVKWDKDPVVDWTGYCERNPVAGLWTIKPGKPCRGRFEDYRVDMLAQPCVLFLSKERYWKR